MKTKTFVLFCPECLCAGNPEVIFHAPVPLKVGFSNRNGLQGQSEAKLTQLASAAVERIYVRAKERNMPLYTVHLLFHMLHCTLLYYHQPWLFGSLLHDNALCFDFCC